MADNYEDEYLTEEDLAKKKLDRQAAYNKTYRTKIEDQMAGLGDEREDVLDELNRMSYTPSGNGALDAELVFLKAEKAARQSNRIEDKNVKSYARYIERDRGLTKAEVRKMIRKSQIRLSDLSAPDLTRKQCGQDLRMN